MTIYEALDWDIDEYVRSPTMDLSRLFDTGEVSTCEVNRIDDGKWLFEITTHDETQIKFSLTLSQV
jgi:hypothetical protein